MLNIHYSFFCFLLCIPTINLKIYNILYYCSVEIIHKLPYIQFSSVAQSCPTLHDPMNRRMPGLPVHHQLPESTQTYVHRVNDPIQPSHSLSSPSPPALNLSQLQGLFKWVSSLHQVAKILEFQLTFLQFHILLTSENIFKIKLLILK